MANRFTHEEIDLRDKNVAELTGRKVAIMAALVFARKQHELYGKEASRLHRVLIKNNEALERFTDRYKVKA